MLTKNNKAQQVAQETSTVPPVPFYPPAAPSYLTATLVAPNRVYLTWQDNSNNEKGFRIRRKGPGETSFRTIADVGYNVTYYTDDTVRPIGVYTYRVKAFNDAGVSTRSNDASVFTKDDLKEKDKEKDSWEFPLPLAGAMPSSANEQRLAHLEAEVGQLRHFIGSSLRPDLNAGTLGAAADDDEEDE